MPKSVQRFSDNIMLQSTRTTIRHGDKRRAAAVRPALQADAVGQHVGARAQIGERRGGVARPHRDFVDRVRAILVAAAPKALRIAARPEAVDQERQIALRGPERAPILMPL